MDCGTKLHGRKFTPEAEEVYAAPSKSTNRGEVAFLTPMINVEHETEEDDAVFQDEEKTSLGWADFILKVTHCSPVQEDWRKLVGPERGGRSAKEAEGEVVEETVEDDTDSGAMPTETLFPENPPDIPDVVFIHAVEDEGTGVKAVVEL